MKPLVPIPLEFFVGIHDGELELVARTRSQLGQKTVGIKPEFFGVTFEDLNEVVLDTGMSIESLDRTLIPVSMTIINKIYSHPKDVQGLIAELLGVPSRLSQPLCYQKGCQIYIS
jgi:hypothetical protein